MTTEELRLKAIEAVDKAQKLPRFIMSDNEKRWLKAGSIALGTIEGEAFLGRVIREHNRIAWIDSQQADVGEY